VRPFPEAQSGAATDRVLGTYLHGLFENEVAREAFVDSVYEHARRERPSEDSVNRADDPLDRAADLVEEHVDLESLGF
jgi:adenosylcobyric acid synthase